MGLPPVLFTDSEGGRGLSMALQIAAAAAVESEGEASASYVGSGAPSNPVQRKREGLICATTCQQTIR